MYASLYPSIIRQFNVAPNTQIGMLKIDQQVHNKENRCKLENWTRSMAFMEDIQSQMWLEFCTRWFNLADYTTLYHEVEVFFSTIMNPYYGMRYFNREGLIIPMTFYEERTDLDLQEAMDFDDNRRIVEQHYPVPNIEEWRRWIDAATRNPNQHF